MVKLLVIICFVNFLYSCSPQVIKYTSNQLIPLKKSLVTGAKHKVGTVDSGDTLLFGKIQIRNTWGRDITKHCAVQFVEHQGDKITEIHSHLYGRQYGLGSYSDIGSDNFYASKVPLGEIELSHIECSYFPTHAFGSSITNAKQSINFFVTIKKPGHKYYFGNIVLFISKENSLSQLDDAFIEDKRDFHKSIPTSNKLPTKKSLLKKKEQPKGSENQGLQRINRALNILDRE